MGMMPFISSKFLGMLLLLTVALIKSLDHHSSSTAPNDPKVANAWEAERSEDRGQPGEKTKRTPNKKKIQQQNTDVSILRLEPA